MTNLEIEIENLLIIFFKKMNEWEKYCKIVSKDNSLSYDEQEEKQRDKVKDIFLKYCTQKDRKMGKPNYFSYGDEGSYEYNEEEEKITEIVIENKTKIVVTTKREKPLEELQKYVIKKVSDKWLIDSKKNYSSWEDKWENILL